MLLFLLRNIFSRNFFSKKYIAFFFSQYQTNNKTLKCKSLMDDKTIHIAIFNVWVTFKLWIKESTLICDKIKALIW